MTDLQRFNLYWICNAMTMPAAAEDVYYYDGLTKKFFVQSPLALSDMIGLPLHTEQADTFRKRLVDVDTEASQIVEIPRLNVQDKVAVQLLFLSRFLGIIHEEKLRIAAEQQADAHGFVMDKLEAMDEVLAPMLSYWEDFKLKTIQYYLEKFTGITGITLKML